MRRRSYQAVVKSKSQSVSARQMRVYYIRRELIRISERSEKSLSLSLKIISFAYVNNLIANQRANLLAIAKYSAILFLLCVDEESLNIVLIAVKKHQRRARRVVSVFHSG